MRPLAVVGNLSLDVVDGGPPRVGGGPFYAARALRALGQPAVVVTKCAEEDRRRVLRPLAALGIPVRVRPAATTAGFHIRNADGTRAMRVEQLGEAWSVDDARWAVASSGGAKWMQVAPLARHEFPPQTLEELARGGRRLLLDGQGLARPARTGPLELDGDYDPSVLVHVAVLKLAEEEADALLGGTDEARIASLGVPEVVVTLGERGALVWSGGTLSAVGTLPVRGAVDPTGAGDAFGAAYLSSRALGRSPTSAARNACVVVGALLEGQA